MLEEFSKSFRKHLIDEGRQPRRIIRSHDLCGNKVGRSALVRHCYVSRLNVMINVGQEVSHHSGGPYNLDVVVVGCGSVHH